MLIKNENPSTASLWDEDLNKARSGLEEQVLSLTKLAEGIVAEADSRAKELQEQALNEAKTEAQDIIAHARVEAKNLVEEREREALALAKEKTEMIQASSEKLQQTYVKLKSQLQNLQQQLTIFEVDIDHTISSINGNNDSAKEVEGVINTTVANPKHHNEISPQIEQKGKPTDTDKKGINSSIKSKETDNYEGDIELEVMPPVSKDKVKEIINSLDNLAGIETVQYIPTENRPMIALLITEPIPLLDILKTMPQISRVWEVKNKSKVIIGAGYSKGKIRRLQLSLWL